MEKAGEKGRDRKKGKKAGADKVEQSPSLLGHCKICPCYPVIRGPHSGPYKLAKMPVSPLPPPLTNKPCHLEVGSLTS